MTLFATTPECSEARAATQPKPAWALCEKATGRRRRGNPHVLGSVPGDVLRRRGGGGSFHAAGRVRRLGRVHDEGFPVGVVVGAEDAGETPAPVLGIGRIAEAAGKKGTSRGVPLSLLPVLGA